MRTCLDFKIKNAQENSMKTYFPKFTLSRNCIWPKLHFPENLFSRINTFQNFDMAEIIFLEKFIFQNYAIVDGDSKNQT